MARKKTLYYPQGGVHLKHAAISPHISHTVSGVPPLTIRCSDEQLIKSITIYGNTINGSGVGEYNSSTGFYDIPITVTGKNLFSPYSTFDSDIIASQSSSVTVEKTELRLRPNTTYTCSTNAPRSDYDGRSVSAVFIITRNANPSTSTDGVSVSRPRTVTTTADGLLYIMIRTIQTYNELVIQPEDLINGTYTIQLEEGDSISGYTPYSAQSYKISSNRPLYYNMEETYKLHDISLSPGPNHLFVNTTTAPLDIKLRCRSL